ncbi:hypothetical protein [Lacisediminimonas profundi]|uniref:hypothetical protein n=1 Tax=Lacisediminimonas profundi TaxID=2603856 RepID=UPI00124B9F14|nr:hypothetical protein [Lacisediminimonas profundi]
MLRERIFKTVAEEVRHAYQLAEPADADDPEMDVELVWALHASIFYLGMRKWVYKSGLPKVANALIKTLIEGFIGAMKQRRRADGLSTKMQGKK